MNEKPVAQTTDPYEGCGAWGSEEILRGEHRDVLAERYERLREALEWIRNHAFYHMVRHADERGDRKVLGEIKEFAIKTLRECEDV